jgi:uncharacterized membrane protein YhaH (DUF805 family)
MSIGNLLWSYEGRIGRARFWLGVLLVILISMAFGAVGGLLNILPVDPQSGELAAEEIGAFGLLYALVTAVVLIYAQLAVYVKRFHDRGKSGWWVLIAFVPVIGFFWILIELGMLPGDPGPNAYGLPEPGGGTAVHA